MKIEMGVIEREIASFKQIRVTRMFTLLPTVFPLEYVCTSRKCLHVFKLGWKCLYVLRT